MLRHIVFNRPIIMYLQREWYSLSMSSDKFIVYVFGFFQTYLFDVAY